MRFIKHRVGSHPWNASCGSCRTTWLGGWESKEEADAYLRRHRAMCTVVNPS